VEKTRNMLSILLEPMASDDTRRGPISRLLADVRAGRAAAWHELIPLIYDDVRRIARGQLKRERPHHTLESRALANEAFTRMIDRERPLAQNREHLFRAIRMVMHHLLIDYGRRYRRVPEGTRVAFVEADLPAAPTTEGLVEMGKTLERLVSEIDEQTADVVECRLAGYTEEETAAALGLPRSTVGRLWRPAKARLQEISSNKGRRS
jgi:RNA polymerase sigma-70 factor, ECF subfamily